MSALPTSSFQMLIDADIALEMAISIERASMLERQRAGDIGRMLEAQREMLRLIAQRRPPSIQTPAHSASQSGVPVPVTAEGGLL